MKHIIRTLRLFLRKPRYFVYFNWIFGIAALLELLINLSSDYWQIFRLVTKPSILIILSIYFWYQTPVKTTQTRLFQAALFFALAGDFLLLFTETNSVFFQMGIGAFLVTQVLYAVVFSKDLPPNRRTFIRRNLWITLIFLAYQVVLIGLIFDRLGELFIPVIVYSSAILIMVLSAINRFGHVSSSSFKWVAAGAILFMISDSLLAIQKFYLAFPLASFWVMLTYISAQYLIVIGWLKNKETAL